MSAIRYKVYKLVRIKSSVFKSVACKINRLIIWFLCKKVKYEQYTTRTTATLRFL